MARFFGKNLTPKIARSRVRVGLPVPTFGRKTEREFENRNPEKTMSQIAFITVIDLFNDVLLELLASGQKGQLQFPSELNNSNGVLSRTARYQPLIEQNTEL